MSHIDELLKRNIQWSEAVKQKKTNFFTDLAKQQQPQYLCISCSDSRVPVDTIFGSSPGEIFVHRNIANVIDATDTSCTSVIQFAVDYLAIKDIIVMGHYGCGGVKCSLHNTVTGKLNTWITKIERILSKHKNLLDKTPRLEQLPLLCRLNAVEQALNLCMLDTVQNTWSKNKQLTIHCLIYNIINGRVEDTTFKVSDPSHLQKLYNNAIEHCFSQKTNIL
jgi:carbonic anhydrase